MQPVQLANPGDFFNHFTTENLTYLEMRLVQSWYNEDVKKLHIIPNIGFIILHKLDFDPTQEFETNVYLIDYIFVKQNFRGKGYGSQLIHQANLLHNLTALVDESDSTFYSKLNFKCKGKTPDKSLYIYTKQSRNSIKDNLIYMYSDGRYKLYTR